MSCGAAWPPPPPPPAAASRAAGPPRRQASRNQNPAAQRLQEVAPVELEVIRRFLTQLVAFGLEIDYDRGVRRSSAGLLDGFGRDRERGDDPRIGATAADIAVHVLDDFFARGLGVLAQEADARHDHAAGAIAALHGASLEERLLERVELAVLLEALDRRDLAQRRPRRAW